MILAATPNPLAVPGASDDTIFNRTGQNVNVGFTNASTAQSNDNILTIGTGGTVTNVAALTVGSGTGTATAVTVSNGNTLGGTGTINGPVTFDSGATAIFTVNSPMTITGVMTFSMLNAASRGSATLSVEHSSDLGISDAWTTVAVPDASGGPTGGVTFTVTPGSPLNSVTATISSSEAAGGKLFGRLKETE